MHNRSFFWIIPTLSIFLLTQSSAYSLPWDVDMYSQESLKANEVARSPVKGTIPIGRKPFTMTAEEAEMKLKNPVPLTLDSAWRGRRLWNANCLTCHGKQGDGAGPVGPQMGVPSLLSDYYKGRTDGRIYWTIVNGGSIMPRYGFKFSEVESWNVINYLRFLQGREIAGLKRPQ